MRARPGQEKLHRMFEQIIGNLEQGTCENGSSSSSQEREKANADRIPSLPWINLYVLGRTRIKHGGSDLGFDCYSDTARLLSLLSSRLGRPMPIDNITSTLWPGLGRERAEAYLIEAVSHLCSALGTSPDSCPVIRCRGTIGLRVGEYVWLDANELVEAAISDVPARRERAINLYRGDPFSDYPYDSWTLLPRELLRATYVDIARRESDEAKACHDYARGADFLGSALKADPYEEGIYCDAINANIDLGRYSIAIKQARKCRDNLANIGMAPSTRFEEIDQQLQPYAKAAPRRFS